MMENFVALVVALAFAASPFWLIFKPEKHEKERYLAGTVK
jgi:hypothetical protein